MYNLHHHGRQHYGTSLVNRSSVKFTVMMIGGVHLRISHNVFGGLVAANRCLETSWRGRSVTGWGGVVVPPWSAGYCCFGSDVFVFSSLLNILIYCALKKWFPNSGRALPFYLIGHI